MQDVYETNKYIFVSYAHKDAPIVLPIIDALRQNGYTVWYDQGIEAGTEWPEYIAQRIEECGVFLACISPASMQSNNCRNEINFALSLKKDCLSVYLEETKMTAGMQLQLGSLQALFKYRHKTDASFHEALVNATLLQKIQRVPAPIQEEIITTSQTPATEPKKSEPPIQSKSTEQTKKIITGTAIFCLFILLVDYLSMWLSTKYISNGFFMTMAAFIPALAVGAVYLSNIKKTVTKLSLEEQEEVSGCISALILFTFLLAAIGDCFLVFCTSKIIFKILISLGINVLRYFTMIAFTPSTNKHA